MSYQVIARKWRPQLFNEVVFQDHVSRTLSNSIENGRISHAYLFSGPRGVGKTTMARILAKAINCDKGPTTTPCGKCDNCREIKLGTSFDVIEIDGASNRGIEDIRELRENVNFAPVKARYKVYIIDEVHMLTKEAFNALLKTLEEPPPHAVFILATTEIHQIPETILSRCQKFFFKKIPISSIVEHLATIVEKEGYKVSGRALYPIARAAEGSMRDAQSLLDQVIAFSDMTDEAVIHEEDALSILGIVPMDSYIRQIENIAALDQVAVINEVDHVASMGVDIPRYIAGFIDALRSLRLIKNGISIQELLGLSREEVSSLSASAENYYEEELGSITARALELNRNLRYSFNERIDLEMALLDMVSLKKMPSLAEVVQKLNSMPMQENSTPLNDSVAEAAPEQVIEKESQGSAKKKRTGEESTQNLTFDAAWQQFLGVIQDSKQYLYFILQPARTEYKDSILEIIFPESADHAYYKRLLDSKNQEIIKDELSRLMGVDLAVRIHAESKTIGKGDPALVVNEQAGVSSDTSPVDGDLAPLPEAEMIQHPEADENTLKNPTVEKVKDIFHGEIVDLGEK